MIKCFNASLEKGCKVENVSPICCFPIDEDYIIKEFVEKNVDTDYIVINSHGHSDHIGGNNQFDRIYANKDEWDVIEHFTLESTGEKPQYELCELKVGNNYDLGYIHFKVISMEGQTKGSVGFY